MRWTLALVIAFLALGCQPSVLGRPGDAASNDAARGDAQGTDAGGVGIDGSPGDDAAVVPGTDASGPDIDAYVSPFGPPLARPPSGPPDHAYVITALAAERPDLLAGSCVAMGGSNAFLFEAAHRLRAIDPRYGLVMRGGAMLQDRVAYFHGDGAAEGSSQIYVLDVIASHCSRPGIDAPAGPSWGDDTAAGGTWTILPLGTPGTDAGMPPPTDAGMPPTMLPLPDERDEVNALAADRPDLLAASCVDDGGNNEFLFELVRRLRRIDPRWGLNWKRGVVGDMSQDVVNYYFGAGSPVEGSTDVYIIDVIGGHCGPGPSPAFTDVTEATRAGGTIGRWTLAGRSDLGP